MNIYNQEQLDRIGNTIIYLAENVSNLNKTQLLKLLFLIEETSVDRYHKPFLGLEFEVWKYGPVARDIFIDLSDDVVLLQNYVKITCDCDQAKTIIPIKEFCDDEFSDNDMDLLADIITSYGRKSATKLVDYTHNKKGIWYKLAVEHNLIKPFDANMKTNSNIVIDLSSKLSGCDKEFYDEQLEAMQFMNSLRN